VRLAVLALLVPLTAQAQDLPVLVKIPGAGFRMAKTEISVAQWQACAREGGCKSVAPRFDEPDLPMTEITARDAEAYAAWLSGKVKARCRLPNEAEWDLAARAGTATTFPWGDAMQPGKAVCHHCDPRFDHRPAPVGFMVANPFGLHDMNGNVWEWTAECVAPGCDQRVVKGGSWYFVAVQSRTGSRAPQDARSWSYDIGFRPLCD
jgi:formylglycine-generating enzyme required for sulfatase activity